MVGEVSVVAEGPLVLDHAVAGPDRRYCYKAEITLLKRRLKWSVEEIQHPSREATTTPCMFQL